MKLKICATGDLMLLRPFPPEYDQKVWERVIWDCDVKITNLESVVSNWDCFASSFCGGQWINTVPKNLDSIEKFGFNFYSCANNHSMDYSFDGLLSTKKELERRGWIHAGIGRSLDEASAASIMIIPDKNIKVAFISVTSTFIDAARAGNGRGEIPPRPGINPLRVQTRYLVTREHYLQLKEIAEGTYINGERDNARKIGSLPPEEEGSINFGGHFFVVTDGNEGKFTYCNKQDLKRITDEVKKAKQVADYVVVCIHSHQIKRVDYFEPDYFLEEFAHSCIDAGACTIFGGGTHQLKPIEIYAGKPIFYSLGNFVFESDRIPKLPADFWDKYNYPEALTVAEGLARKTKNGTIGLETDKANYLSVIPIVDFDDDTVVGINLIPVELNFDNTVLKGLPHLASGFDEKFIYDQLCKISAEYGTRFELTTDGIRIQLSNNDL